MVVLRFFFGWWPAKLPTLLNIILMVGYCTIDGILGGQLLAAVSGDVLSVAVGVVVVNVACAAVVLLGMRPFQRYEHHAWLPQLLILAVLIGCAGPRFDVSIASVGPPATVAANRLSFLSMCLYVPNSWSAAASDFYVYYPESTSPIKVAALTIGGLWVSFSLVFMIGYACPPPRSPSGKEGEQKEREKKRDQFSTDIIPQPQHRSSQRPPHRPSVGHSVGQRLPGRPARRRFRAPGRLRPRLCRRSRPGPRLQQHPGHLRRYHVRTGAGAPPLFPRRAALGLGLRLCVS